MNVLELIFLAVALSIDSFAVSVTLGMLKGRISKGVIFMLLCALCQGGLLLLGELLGNVFKSEFDSLDHWIAFSLLFVIGVKMLIEARKVGDKNYNFNAGKFIILLGLAVATSIDAFVVGIGVGMQTTTFVHKIFAALLTAGMTYAFSFFGFFIGRRQKVVSVKWAMALGGLVLIGLGVKILIEHHVFG